MYKKLILSLAAAAMLSVMSLSASADIVKTSVGTITKFQVNHSTNTVQVQLSSEPVGQNYYVLADHPNRKEIVAFLLTCWTTGKQVQFRIETEPLLTIHEAGSPGFF